MARRRDWDKVARERRVFLNGSLRYWTPDWAPSGSDAVPPRAARSANRTATPAPPEDDFGEWTLLRLEYAPDSIAVPLPYAYSYEADAVVPRSTFDAQYVYYTCTNIPQDVRESLVLKHLAPITATNHRQQITNFVTELFRRCRFIRTATRGSTVFVEFEWRDKAPKRT